MKKIIFFLTLTTLSVANAIAQDKADTSQDKKFAAALETQVSCWHKPEPFKAIRALQRAGIISRKPYIVVDSVSYFRTKKPLNVLGYKIYAVSGFDYTGNFARTAGTAPGTWLGIVVPFSVQDVKAKLKNLYSQKINIEKIDIDIAEDEIGPKAKTHAPTEIACIGW